MSMDPLDSGETVRGYMPGQKVFNRYTLKKILGRGGMGVVWLALDNELDTEVALKFLPEVVALDREAVADMKKETRRSLRLTHANIVRIYDFLQDPRAAAISMEYIDGASLSGRKGDQPDGIYPLATLRPVLDQLCAALDYAHNDPKIVHRDLKPANLMLDARGRLKIADFGIARSISDSVSRVSAQAGSSGTPAYMSPQQMMGGEPAVADDIYSLGATLYELLTSKPPFHTGNLIAQVQGRIPPPMAEQRRTLGVSGEPIPPEWEETVAACLTKEPADRPQSAREIAGRLGLIPGFVPPKRRSEPASVTPPPAPVAPPPVSAQVTPTVVAKPATKPLSTGANVFMIVAALLLAAVSYYVIIYRPRAAEQEAKMAAMVRQQEEARQQTLLAQQQAAEQAAKDKTAREQLEKEQQAYVTILGQIREVPAETSPAARTQAGQAVTAYLATAPERYRDDVQKAWQQRLGTIADATATGSMLVSSQPARATVWLDGAMKGQAPLVLNDLAPGMHTVRLVLPGFNDWTGSVTVEKNRRTEVQQTLLAQAGALRLTSDPAGAEVWQGGRQLGTTPLTLTNVAAGTVAYEFRLSGYGAARANIGAKAGETVERNVVLARLVPYPQAGSTARGTFFYYDGAARGRTAFTFQIDQVGRPASAGGEVAFSGRISEPRNDFGPTNVSTLTSTFRGRWIPREGGARIIFTKTYDYDGHATAYECIYSTESASGQGDWNIDGYKGGFTLSGIQFQ